MWVQFVAVLFSSLRGFSPGTPVFPSPQKPTFPNSNSILECMGISETSSCELLGALWLNKLLFFYIYIQGWNIILLRWEGGGGGEEGGCSAIFWSMNIFFFVYVFSWWAITWRARIFWRQRADLQWIVESTVLLSFVLLVAQWFFSCLSCAEILFCKLLSPQPPKRIMVCPLELAQKAKQKFGFLWILVCLKFSSNLLSK